MWGLTSSCDALIVVASLVAKHRLESVWASEVAALALSRGSRALEHRLSGCGARSQLP